MKLNIRSITRNSFTAVAVLSLTATMSLPVTSYAVEGSETCSPTKPPAGVSRPTGSDAGTYAYNCATNLWENEHYTYDPLTYKTTAKQERVYVYNSATGQYDYTVWLYSPASNSFYQANRSVAQPPAGAQTVGGPTPAPAAQTPNTANGGSAAGGSAADGSAADGSSSAATTSAQNSSQAVGATGPGSNNNLTTTLNNATNLTNTTNLTGRNNVIGTALSGNAQVSGNTLGGNATTGDADNQATVVNMLQSSSNALGSGSNVKTFTYDIDGDVYGDLFFDPAMLNAVQNGSADTDVNTTINNDLTVNNTTNATLDNTIDLYSQSGNATVSNNTQGGDATTGNARAVANVVNLINSAITSGQSFIGTVNINGNFNGDILLPPDFIDQLIASNIPTVQVTVPNSTNSNNATVNNTTNITNTNNFGINNNVNATAISGNAAVAGNTAGGTATTGDATTNVTAFNLTGSQVVGRNSMLVFVNVMGEWVGLIVNAPAGATAAQLGGGIQSNTTINNNADINNTNNFEINNDINVVARSGDAAVRGNTQGGNARSGDAETAVNLSNIQNSSFAFSDWFGILFINVFGSWNGSFGVDTEAGNRPTPAPATGGRGGGATSGGFGGNATVTSPVQVFRFAASAASGSAATNTNDANTDVNLADYQKVLDTTAANMQGDGAVLSAETADQPGTTQDARQASNLWQTASIIGALVVLFIVADAINSYRKRKQA